MSSLWQLPNQPVLHHNRLREVDLVHFITHLIESLRLGREQRLTFGKVLLGGGIC